MGNSRSEATARWIDRGILFVASLVSFWVAFRLQSDEPGTPLHVTQMVLTIVSLSVVYLWVETRRLRRRLGGLAELLDDVRFGSGARRDREAVDILVKALRAPDARAKETALRTLRKISGYDFGEDPATWEAWWKASRPTFVRAGSPAPDRPPPGKL